MFKVNRKIKMPNTRVANNPELFVNELKEFFNKWGVSCNYEINFKTGELVINAFVGKQLEYDEYERLGYIELKN